MAKTPTPDTRWYTAALAADRKCKQFRIKSADELAGLAAITNGTAPGIARCNFVRKSVILLNDIDLSDYANWMPIGAQGCIPGSTCGFAGYFCGGGGGRILRIRNLSIDRADENHLGLFGCLHGARIENIYLENARIFGQSGVGGMAGHLKNSHIYECLVGGLIGGINRAGGIAGALDNKSSVSCCNFAGMVLGKWYIGGIAGRIENKCRVENCSSSAQVSLVFEAGDEDAEPDYGDCIDDGGAGGIVGYVYGKSSVANCHSAGTVTGGNRVGGIAGDICELSSAAGCYSTCDVHGTNEVGGIAGMVSCRSRLADCAALNPNVSAEVCNVARIAGYVSGDSWTKVKNCIAYNGMLNRDGAAKWERGGGMYEDLPLFSGVAGSAKWERAAVLHGTDAGIDLITTDETLGGLFINGIGGWMTETGKLPGFNVATAMPEHLRGDKPDTGWYNAADASFKISTADQLAGLADIVNGNVAARIINGSPAGFANDSFLGKTVRLTADIDLSAYKNWEPIGNSRTPFEGTFDGGGHEIRNLTINHPNSNDQGLFGSIETGGRAENVRLAGVNIIGCQSVGAVAGNLGGGRVEGETDDGEACAVNCSADGYVYGKEYIGGIAGLVIACSKVIGCRSACTVVGNIADNMWYSGDDAVGGVAGAIIDGCEVVRCSFTGEVHANAGNAGGVVGLVGDYSLVSNCCSSGEVRSTGRAGGVAGHVDDCSSDGIVSYCYATGAVIGGRETGGIAGYIALPYSVANCAALNPLVKSCSEYCGNTGRVTGKAPKNTAHKPSSMDNAAFSGMTVDVSEASEGNDSSGGGLVSEDGDMVTNEVFRNREAINALFEENGSDEERNADDSEDIPDDDICMISEDGEIITNETSRNRKAINALFEATNALFNDEWNADNGEDLSDVAIRTDGSIGGRFTAENGWTTENGKLPGFGEAVEMPEHLR